MPRISSRSLQIFMATQKSQSIPHPKLWPHLNDATEIDEQEVRTLTPSHPILRTLESSTPTPKQFNQIHTQLLISGLFQHSLAFSRVVMKVCSHSLSRVSYSVNLFDRFNEPDAFICNIIIRGFVNFDDPFGGLRFYNEKMVGRFVWPNHYTFPIVLKACGEMSDLKEGEKGHGRIVKLGYEFDLFVRNSLIRMYSVCGRVWDAQKVFDLSCMLDLVTWNLMLDGYVKNGEVGLGRWLFGEMKERDLVSWNSMVAGYVGVGDMEGAKELFDEMPCRDVVSWNCLVDGYARIGDVVSAREFFDQMGFRNVVSWNTMLALYVRCKKYVECLGLFDRMMQEGHVLPNEATLMSVLTACAQLGDLERGKLVHSFIENSVSISPDVLLSTALLTMYSKCGVMDLARKVFDSMLDRTVVSWNAMIMGYGMHGHADKAIQIFSEMERNGQMPNDATFTCILSACSHAGKVLEGWWFFDLMKRVYHIEHKMEHYGCLVDLLGRAGLVKDSEEIIKKIPMEAEPTLLGALLSACRTHSNLELGEAVAKQLLELAPEDIGSYVQLSNMYAAEGRWDNVEYVRKVMMQKELQKVQGSSVSK